MAEVTEDQKLARYGLLCRALQAQPTAGDPILAIEEPIAELSRLIQHDLLALARQASPDDFAELYLEFEQELKRFREFAAYSNLASKTVVAFGGSFSAGKSSLINAVMGEALMVVEVDPTTALPAYVLTGETDAIYALNHHGLRIQLTEDEFASLTHDEQMLYDSQVSRSLSTAFVVRKEFPWHNLAFIDTPGYSGQTHGGGRTDASIAAAQLNSAHALVWVVNAKQGVIPETDIDFLAKLDPSIPRLIVVSRADQLNESDLQAIVERIRITLAERNLPVLDVLPASAHPRHKTLLAPIIEHLDNWNQSAQQQTFAKRFKSLFVRYQRGLEAERNAIQWRENRLQRLQLLAEADLLESVEELAQESAEKKQRLEVVSTELAGLRSNLFTTLKRVGDQVGIVLPEPHEMELLEVGRSNFLELLVVLRQEKGTAELDLHQALSQLRQDQSAQHQALLLRRMPRTRTEHWSAIQTDSSASLRPFLLRRPLNTTASALHSLEA